MHLELGHVGHQPRAVEEKVREHAARQLVPLQALYMHRHWQGRLYGLAEDLGVTEAVLTDRLRWLTQEERMLLGLLFWGPGES